MIDKRTITVVLACMLALFGFQALINKIYPPLPKKPRPAAETNTVSNVVAQVAAAVTNGPVAQWAPATAEPPPARPAEQIAVLSNRFVRVEITSWGGGVRTVELLQYKADHQGQVVLNATADTPALALRGLPGHEGAYEFSAVTATSLVMRAIYGGGATVVKELVLGPDYLLHGTVQVTPLTTQTVQIVVGQAAPLLAAEAAQFVGVDWLAGTRYQNRDLGALWKNNAQKLYIEPTSAPWGAVKNQFFAMVLTPSTNAVAVHYLPQRLAIPTGWTGKQPPDAANAALEVPATRTGETATWAFTFYAGPKEYNRLAALGKGQEDVMGFGFWGPISVVLLKSMKICFKLVPNYGVAIILITIAIKLVFWPIQAKSIQSMKQMQKFQPMMAKLKEKYKDDSQRMNQEMMKLYKEHKINPFGGCLPMLVQIPVFFGLFAMLRSAIELRGAPFFWIRDLSQPDTIFHIAGLPVNPLPLVMTAAMVWQQKLTPTTGDAQQAKMMMFMPLIMLVFFYNASSGLALYWTVQQFLSIAQQWWSLRQPGAALAVAPAKPK